MGEFDQSADSASPERRDDLLRNIFNYSNDAILVIDAERDQIVEANPRTCELLGYSRDELLSMPISTIHPEEMDRFVVFAKSVFHEGHGWTNELTCRAKTGISIPAEISASASESLRPPIAIWRQP